MDPSVARQTLLHDALDEDGVFTRLRLGQYPGSDSVKRLRLALRVVWRELAKTNVIPRGIAFACGVILHFSSESLRNLGHSGALRADSLHEIESDVTDLAQGAFDLLAGEESHQWVVTRADLGESAGEKGT